MKRRDNRGFTLIEMLIVVGIIAVLVAVSIPMVNSSLEKARIATDAANERAAKATMLTTYLTGGLNDFFTKQGQEHYASFPYDAANGTLLFNADRTSVGSLDNMEKYGRCEKHRGKYIQVTLDRNKISINWVGGTGGSSQAHSIDAENPLS